MPINQHTNPTVPTSPKAKGGLARAKKLSRARRSEIAKKAAAERWSDVRTAEYGDQDHPLVIGGSRLPCYVLDDGTRVFSQRGMLEALTLPRGSAAIPRLVDRLNLAEVAPEASEALDRPIRFYQPRGGPTALGYPVTLLIDICNAMLALRDSGNLPDFYAGPAARAEIFVRAVAKVGIVALVDEVTGYQDKRHKEALQALLDAYLRREFAIWAKRFPDDFYREMFRLRGWDWRGPGYSGHAVAKYTNDLVYARLAPALLEELEKRNPRVDNRRRAKHHQWLSDDLGLPALAQHLHAVVALMKAADTWNQFKNGIDRALPIKDAQLAFELEVPSEA